MTLTEYLSSPDAERDVAIVLARSGDPLTFWVDYEDRTQGAWRVMTVQPDAEAVRVYYRPEGDRYIVSDLGEAQRALRLRTGRLDVEHLAEEVISGATWADEHDRPAGLTMTGGALRTFNACVYGAEIDTVAASALPRAIVATMLASHRLATLEIP